MSHRLIKISQSSLPVPLQQRNWNGFILGAVLTTTGIATWSFVVGGTAGFYLDAKMGAAAMLAGGLIGQMLTTLATVPVSTKHGLETAITTVPQLGVRGSYFGLLIVYCTALGWNSVLLIFFGRSVASSLTVLGIISSEQRDSVAWASSAAALIVIALFVTRGAKSLSKVGPVVAVSIIILSIWMMWVLVGEFGMDAILAAQPLEPVEGRLVNYTIVTEMLIAGTFGWWGYMGGLTMMASSARRALMPSMLGLGAAWTLVAVVSLVGTLMTGEPDPTMWIGEIAGPAGTVIVLVFISIANLSSALIGGYVATLGVKTIIPAIGHRFSWPVVTAITLAPMLIMLLFFANFMYDNVGIFMAFLGLMIGPVIGIQIADWYALKRNKTLQVSHLFINSSESRYWYWKGLNLVGVAAILLGSLTYLLILDPLTLVPHVSFFQYTTATLPSVLVSGVSYYALSKIFQKQLEPKWAPESELMAEPEGVPQHEQHKA